MHSGLLDCFHHEPKTLESRKFGRGVPSAKHEQREPTHTNTQDIYKMPFKKHVYDRDVMEKNLSFTTDSCKVKDCPYEGPIG